MTDQEILMARYKHPEYRGVLEHPSAQAGELNPSCGDQITMYVVIKDDSVQLASFTGSGCVISQAAADLLAEFVVGKSINQIMQLTADDMRGLVGVPLGPTRLRCALLAIQVLHRALTDYHSTH